MITSNARVAVDLNGSSQRVDVMCGGCARGFNGCQAILSKPSGGLIPGVRAFTTEEDRVKYAVGSEVLFCAPCHTALPGIFEQARADLQSPDRASERQAASVAIGASAMTMALEGSMGDGKTVLQLAEEGLPGQGRVVNLPNPILICSSPNPPPNLTLTIVCVVTGGLHGC